MATPDTVTLAEFDQLESECGLVSGEFLQRVSATLRTTRPLVEEAECKRRIEAAGFHWAHRAYSKAMESAPLRIWSPDCDADISWFQTWPEAAAWAEARAEKREPTLEQQLAEMLATVTKCTFPSGAVRWDVESADGRHRSWWPCSYSTDERPMLERSMLAFAAAHRKPMERWSKPVEEMTAQEACDLIEAFGAKPDHRWHTHPTLRGAARDAWDPQTDRIRLPEVPA